MDTYIVLQKAGSWPMFYEIRIWQEEGEWVVLAEWGKLGHASQSSRVLHRGAGAQATCERVVSKLKRKGYRVVRSEE